MYTTVEVLQLATANTVTHTMWHKRMSHLPAGTGTQFQRGIWPGMRIANRNMLPVLHLLQRDTRHAACRAIFYFLAEYLLAIASSVIILIIYYIAISDASSAVLCNACIERVPLTTALLPICLPFKFTEHFENNIARCCTHIVNSHSQ